MKQDQIESYFDRHKYDIKTLHFGPISEVCLHLNILAYKQSDCIVVKRLPLQKFQGFNIT